MKVYISADIEGIAGMCDWEEATPTHPCYGEFRERMTAHVKAACEAALAAGADELWVKDAHAAGRNLLHAELPAGVRLVRGWSRHPLLMVQELDESFDALGFIGYHSRAGSGGNPLAHTLSSSKLAEVRVSGRPVSEALLYGWAAAEMGVPLAFVSGDEQLCAEVTDLCPPVVTIPVMRGAGASTISIHPDEARERIRAGVREALSRDLAACRLPLPERLTVEVDFKDLTRAHAMSFYPGARLANDRTVALEANSVLDMLRFLVFMTL